MRTQSRTHCSAVLLACVRRRRIAGEENKTPTRISHQTQRFGIVDWLFVNVCCSYLRNGLAEFWVQRYFFISSMIGFRYFATSEKWRSLEKSHVKIRIPNNWICTPRNYSARQMRTNWSVYVLMHFSPVRLVFFASQSKDIEITMCLCSRDEQKQKHTHTRMARIESEFADKVLRPVHNHTTSISASVNNVDATMHKGAHRQSNTHTYRNVHWKRRDARSKR